MKPGISLSTSAHTSPMGVIIVHVHDRGTLIAQTQIDYHPIAAIPFRGEYSSVSSRIVETLRASCRRELTQDPSPPPRTRRVISEWTDARQDFTSMAPDIIQKHQQSLSAREAGMKKGCRLLSASGGSRLKSLIFFLWGPVSGDFSVSFWKSTVNLLPVLAELTTS